VDRGRSVAVKGIPVCGKPFPFAGRRRNAGLGRSTSFAGGSSLVGARTGDNGCPEGAEEGNVVGLSPSKGQALDARAIVKTPLAPQKTRPSLGPLTRARRSPLHTGGETRLVVARSRRYRGRANPRKWEEPAAGPLRLDVARLAARNRFRKGEGASVSEPEGGHGHRPSEERELGFVPARRSNAVCRSR
jgi:hypothetical protein